MSGIIYAPPTGAAVIPDLDQVMNVGNFTTVAYIGTGISLGTRTVTGPATYNVTDTDFLILCDVGAGNVNINVDGAYQNIYSIKLVNWQFGNIARITITGGGTLDGSLTYVLTRSHGSVIIASKQNGGDFAVIGSNDALGSVNSGVYVNGAFTGGTITIPHTLNAIPQGITVEPGNVATANIIGGPYWISRTAANIIINLPVVVVVPTSIEIFWSVTRN
jgi:hypothetical protein